MARTEDEKTPGVIDPCGGCGQDRRRVANEFWPPADAEEAFGWRWCIATQDGHWEWCARFGRLVVWWPPG